MSDSPNYQGAGQPIAGNGGGLLGWLSGVFGASGTPAYAGDGQPSSGASGLLGGGTPAYQAAPPPPATTPDATAPQCPEVDPDPFGSGPIAIVIPRGLTSPQQ